MRKYLFIICCLPLFLFSINDEKSTTIIVSSMGETIDEAKNNALRSAIEQTFGAFISSKTEILNDNIKDEIVSISNGNIHNYKIISQIKIPDGGYAITLEATVSLNQLSSFVKSKGFNVEFQGQIFGANLRQIELNKLAEEKTIDNLCEISYKILAKSLDFSLDVSDPRENKFGNYDLDFYIFSYPNKNYEMFKSFFYKTMKSISMSRVEFKNYQKINKSFYQISIENLKNRHNKLFVFNKPSEKKKKDLLPLNEKHGRHNSFFDKIMNLYNIKSKSSPDLNVNGIYKSNQMDAIYLRSGISLHKLVSFFNETNLLLLSFDLLSSSFDNSSIPIFNLLEMQMPPTNNYQILPDNQNGLIDINSLKSYESYGRGYNKASFPIVSGSGVITASAASFHRLITLVSQKALELERIDDALKEKFSEEEIKKKLKELGINKKDLIQMVTSSSSSSSSASNSFKFNEIKRDDCSLSFFMDNLVYLHLFNRSFTISELEKIKEFKIIKKANPLTINDLIKK